MKALVLAGGYDQIALIKELKSRGYTTILADYFSNPPAKEYADIHFSVSTLDEEAIYELAKRENVQIVTTACTDQALLTAARISEKLSLPCYLSTQTARDVTNKYYMKQNLLASGILTAKFYLLEQNISSNSILLNGNLNYPFIIKPADCNSSKGVKLVENESQRQKAVQAAFSLSRSKKVVMEEYIPGQEVSIDIWLIGKKAKLLCISESDKLHISLDAFTICRSRYPSAITEVHTDKIIDIAEKIANAFNLSDCPLLIQAIVNDKGVYVIEFSPRMGGGTKYRLIDNVAGINSMGIYTDMVLGNRAKNISVNFTKRYWEMDYIYAQDGIVGTLSGFADLCNRGIIKEYYQYKKSGSNITDRLTSGDRVAGILFSANSEKEIVEKRNAAIDYLKILDITGNEITYRESFDH